MPPKETSVRKYDQRLLINMAMSIDTFRRNSPKVFEEIASFGRRPEDIQLSQQTAAELDRVQQGLDQYFSKGQQVIMDSVYYLFAKEQGWVRSRSKQIAKSLMLDLDLPEIIPFSDLKQDQASTFQTFLYTSAAISREVAVRILDNLLNLIYLPHVRYLESPSLLEINEKMHLGIKQLITSMLPDLTDDEAKHFFGQLTSAKQVFKDTQKPIDIY